MKNIFKKYIIVLVALFFSCDDFLTEKPVTFVSPATFWQSEEDARTAVNGIYNMLTKNRTYKMQGAPALWGETGTDELVVPGWVGDAVAFYTYTIQPQNNAVAAMWQEHYTGIARANLVISRVPQMDDAKITELQRNRILGQARFLRAFFYFQMVKMFGSIPLVLTETTGFADSKPSQAASAEVFAAIIEDLEFAEENLPPAWPENDKGRASMGAAKALLGRVYLTMTGSHWNQTDSPRLFQLAADKLKEVIDMSQYYELLDNYADVFKVDNENNKEMIFSVQFQGPGLDIGSDVGAYMGPDGDPLDGAGFADGFTNEQFVLSFHDDDIRLQHNVSWVNFTTGATLTWLPSFRPWKYHREKGPGYYDNPYHFPLIRYADVLLMYAEALNGANSTPPTEAYQAVNAVRKRARMTPPSLPDLTGLSKEQFMDSLLQERSWELCWEGLRKDDLIRTGKLKEYITERHSPQAIDGWYGFYPGGNFKEDTHYLLPIPQRERDINPNLVQNPGY